LIDHEICLADKELCTGCCACYDICPLNCINMDYDEEGFLYPAIDSDICSSCGACTKVCPVINYSEQAEQSIPKTYLAWNLDETIRRQSTSGGISPIFVDYVLREGGAACGAAFDEHFYLVQLLAFNKEDSKRFTGSKYLQSDSRGIYKKTKELLKEGKKILFTGVPCQIRALSYYLGRGYNNLITCETLCHGVPSPQLFYKWIEYLEKKYQSKIVEYNFRDKTNGWDKMTVSVIYENGKKRTYRTRKCNFHVWFGKHLSLRPSCFNCICREKRRYADLTIGDFWGIEQFRPDLDASNGVSVVTVNTEKGQSVLDSCHEHLYLQEFSSDEVFSRRKTVFHNFTIPVERTCFMADFKSLPFEEFVKKYDVPSVAQLVFVKLKSMVGR
jgi:coenzyme F420-reducing hydrogenase beta subunit